MLSSVNVVNYIDCTFRLSPEVMVFYPFYILVDRIFYYEEYWSIMFLSCNTLVLEWGQAWPYKMNWEVAFCLKLCVSSLRSCLRKAIETLWEAFDYELRFFSGHRSVIIPVLPGSLLVIWISKYFFPFHFIFQINWHIFTYNSWLITIFMSIESIVMFLLSLLTSNLCFSVFSLSSV